MWNVSNKNWINMLAETDLRRIVTIYINPTKSRYVHYYF